MPSKESLRKNLIYARKKHPTSNRLEDEKRILEHFISLNIAEKSDSIVGYYPFEDEVDDLSILKYYAQHDHKTGLPAIVNNRLIFQEWKPGSILIEGPLKTQSPLPESSLMIPNVLIVPLVGFDKYGNRLGRGGGFYDSAIQSLRQSISRLHVVGLAFECQFVEKVPIDFHDQKLDLIITPTKVYRFS